MERSFKKEVQALKLGDGGTFRGEGILAVTKALLQSGVSYVGGYQGAPVSHLLDVLVDAEDIIAELGVHLETCTNEASAAAMLGASINYPLRGAVTWKSIVGTNVAADAFIREHKLNEMLPGDIDDIGIIACGGLTNSVLRALERLDLADLFGTSRVPVYVLNVVYPLVPEEVREFCAGKRAVLVVEEGYPDYIEQAVNVELRRADLQTRVHGKDVLPGAGEYTSEVLLHGLAGFIAAARPAKLDA